MGHPLCFLCMRIRSDQMHSLGCYAKRLVKITPTILVASPKLSGRKVDADNRCSGICRLSPEVKGSAVARSDFQNSFWHLGHHDLVQLPNFTLRLHWGDFLKKAPSPEQKGDRQARVRGWQPAFKIPESSKRFLS